MDTASTKEVLRAAIVLRAVEYVRMKRRLDKACRNPGGPVLIADAGRDSALAERALIDVVDVFEPIFVASLTEEEQATLETILAKLRQG